MSVLCENAKTCDQAKFCRHGKPHEPHNLGEGILCQTTFRQCHRTPTITICKEVKKEGEA